MVNASHLDGARFTTGNIGANTMNRSQGSKTGRTTQDRKTHDRATRRSQGSSNYSKQVIEMLTEDHRNAKKLFREGEKLADDPSGLQSIVDQACAALTQHAEIEEEFFYPALREKDAGLIAEAQVEHDSARQLIADLQSMDSDDERYRATFKVLGEYVKHHIKEEEGEIFPIAQKSKADFEPLFEALSALSVSEHAEAGDGATHAAEPHGRGTRSHSRSTPRSGR